MKKISTAQFNEQYRGKENLDEFKIVVATIACNAIEEQLPQFDAKTAVVRRSSKHPDDWYLYHMVIKYKDKEEWAYLGTLNLTTGSINGGSYNLSYDDACKLMHQKEAGW